MTTRRAFIAGLAAVSATACGRRDVARGDIVSAAADADGNHFVLRVDADGSVRYAAPLAERGHDSILSPDRSVVTVVGRRPRRTLHQFRWRDGTLLRTTETPGNRHLYGHALYSADGRWLYTSENNLDDGSGVIVVRDAKTLEVAHEFSSHGIGPHEMRWSDNGRSLIVANGGIATHPDYGRAPLNVDSMAPSLVKIEVKTGALTDKRTPAFSKSSVRHIDVLADGETLVGLQQQAKNVYSEPLVVSADWDTPAPDGELQPLEVPTPDLRALDNYTASVCCAPISGHAVVPSPRGRRVSFWDTRAGRHVASVRLSDVAGVGYDRMAREFVVSSGRGMIYRFDADTFAAKHALKQRIAGYRFDNHLGVINA